ncbi:MAG TPA: hypothetical protein VGG51_04215 [Candidatus Cybelea sp.]|jgi:hypothetical protein
MNTLSLAKYTLGLAAAGAMLAACSSGGGSALGPNSVGTSNGMHLGRAVSQNGILITAAHPNLNAHVTPDKHHRHKKKKADQYIADFSASDVLEFDYPKGDSSIGTISGVSEAQGSCTDVLYGSGKKTFWVTASGTDSFEQFKVGGTSPIATLTTTAGEPVGCSIDPKTGDLAGTMINNGVVVIYKGAKGSGTAISTPLVEAFFSGYDASSNLFIDGFNSQGEFGLVEIPKGKNTAETITTSNSVEFPGSVQWDGKYVTVNDQEAHTIDQYTVKGTTATEEGTVSLSGSSDCDQTWIAKGYVICPDAGNVDGEIYSYPAGGSPLATLTGSFSEPLASVAAAK